MEALQYLLMGYGIGSILYSIYSFGVKKGQQKKPDPVEVNEQDIRKAKQLHEDFQAIMSYDVEKAMQRKKVT